MTKVLVTGGVGFIGTNLINFLKEKNFKIESIDNYSSGSIDNHIKGVKYHDKDLCNINDIKNDFDICFHLAAMSRVQPSFNNPEEYFRVNVLGTTKVMEWAKLNNTKVVYAGSSSKHHNPSDSPYAMYKFLGEEVCKLYKNSFGINVEIARFYNVYGPKESLDERQGNVIGIWRSKVSKNEPLPIVGNGEQRRDFTHVYDVVDGLIKISLSEIKHDDGWELGTGLNYSINELYKMFKDKFNSKCIYIPDQPGNYKLTLRENDDMLDKLNWKPLDRLKSHIESI